MIDKLKVYLDDARPTPDGWVGVKTVDETIRLLKSGRVEALSLDHDLGLEFEVGTGYNVLLWIEEQVVQHGFKPPALILVHSDNSSARIKMELTIKKIRQLWEDKRGKK